MFVQTLNPATLPSWQQSMLAYLGMKYSSVRRAIRMEENEVDPDERSEVEEMSDREYQKNLGESLRNNQNRQFGITGCLMT